MDFATVDAKLAGTRFMTTEQAKVMYDFIREQRISQVLELGFAHGKSSHYMAAAVEEVDPVAGHVTTIDRKDAQRREPNIFELDERTGLGHRITPIMAHTSFTWELMKMLRADPTPRFDMVYIDGGHTWDTTGYAFFLTDMLLKPGGWMVFDDLDWTLGASRSMREKGWVQRLSDEERDEPQVRRVFELLAAGSGRYDHLHEVATWGFARKKPVGSAAVADKGRKAAEAARGELRRRVPVETRRKLLAKVPAPVQRLYRGH